jgi:hypothetical protein
MSWYRVLDKDGNEIKQVWVSNPDDLAANVPDGAEAVPLENDSTTGSG